MEHETTDPCFVGHIAAIDDIVGFHGDSVTQLESAFREAVDDYLDACVKAGKLPDKSQSVCAVAGEKTERKIHHEGHEDHEGERHEGER